MRGHWRRHHPRRIPDRALDWRRRSVVRSLRSGGRGVLRVVGVFVVARACRGGAWPRVTPVDRSLPAIAGGAHHAGIPGRRRRDPDPAAGRRSREPDGVAGESLADPGVRTADVDARADPDVEPVGRGHLLSGVADPCAAGSPAAGPRPGARHRRSRCRQLVLGLDSVRRSGRAQSVELAAGILLLVRRGDAARGVGAQPARVAASAGPTPGADGRRRGGGLSGGRLTAGRARPGWSRAAPRSSR